MLLTGVRCRGAVVTVWASMFRRGRTAPLLTSMGDQAVTGAPSRPASARSGLGVPRTYTMNEVARILGIHVVTARRLAREGTIRAHKQGREWVVTQNSLDEQLARLQAADEARRRASLSRRLVDALSQPSPESQRRRTMHRLWGQPGYRSRVADGMLRANRDPEVRARRSEAARRRWARERTVDPNRE